MATGEIPRDWKRGNITLIFKKGNKRKTWGTAGCSVPPLCPARSWVDKGKATDITYLDSWEMEEQEAGQALPWWIRR